MEPFIEHLLRDGEPCTRLKLARAGLGGDVRALRAEVGRSKRAAMLLSERESDGRIAQHPYAKWTGAHWVLATLADLGYPPGDSDLLPLRDQVLDWLLDERRLAKRRAGDDLYLIPILTVAGRPRFHASLEGNALYSILALGLADERVDALAARLLEYQWPDGGWNCDRSPRASHSSFDETLVPLRGLIGHARWRGGDASRQAADRAAELLLEHRLFRRRSTGAVIKPSFVDLHYPSYWHYDVLFALKVLAEGGYVTDERCADALAVVRAARRPDGGFPAHARYWGRPTTRSRRSLVHWGPTGVTRSNEFVTADATWVLAQAG